MRLLSLTFALVLVGCPTVTKESDTSPIDDDGDGFASTVDCDDANAAVNPDAPEICDGIDNNCDEKVDDATASGAKTFYADADGDSYGDVNTTTVGCDKPDTYVEDNTDCNDADGAVHPGAEELCGGTVDANCDGFVSGDNDGDGYQACDDCDDGNGAINPGASETCDGIDNNCNTTVDENPVDGATWYADSDADGYGDATAPTMIACEQPAGYAAGAGDCKDTDAAYHPGAAEVDCTDPNDYNCDGSAGLTDADADGYPACSDCNDAEGGINAGAAEVCDSIDNNCDGQVDENVGNTTWYFDFDKDGYGDGATSVTACTAPTDYVATGDDCDDADPSVHPNALEQDCADSKDYNCDGSVGETDADGDGLKACADCNDAAADVGGLLTFYADGDVDGYGNANATAAACAAPPGYVADSQDCDDGNNAAFPGNPEVCDGYDNDCNGILDDAPGSGMWYMDMDGDTYGDPNMSLEACSQPTGYVMDGTDCNDGDPSAYPGGVEVCDGVDNDCNGTADDNAADASIWYMDGDSDTYGDAASTLASCDVPTGYVGDNNDCDDANPNAFPGNAEVCDNADNDCNGSIDDNPSNPFTWYADNDGDTYGDPSNTTEACLQPSGYTVDFRDCDDTDAAIHPNASELCDGIDNNCDGTVDENTALDAKTWYADADGDTYGDGGTTTIACSAPTGFVGDATDCNDADATVNPSAAEVCDGVDNDCDGSIDQNAADASIWYADGDGDGYGDAANTLASCSAPAGYVSDATDCNDSSNAAYPGGTEVCDGLDNNCNGTVDGASEATDAGTWYADTDGDTYGNNSNQTVACSAPTGFVADATDCDDSKASVHPGATEFCNSIDDNCDGTIDESTASDAKTWYADTDGDTYGGTTTTKACTQPSGYVATSTDCKDTDAAINPGASEICDGQDNNCNGSIDDNAIDAKTWYKDGDNDSYGGTSTTLSCTQPSGYVATSTDCNDGNASINPAAQEVCDASNTDEDCDGKADDADSSVASSGKSTWYADTDGDTYGNAASTTTACDAPTGYVASSTDCVDTSAAAYPGAAEICRDGLDNDCDGTDDCRLTGVKKVSSADVSGIGGANQDAFGFAVTDRGDLNGDGYDDVVVGAYGYDTASVSNVGRAYVFFGSSSGASLTTTKANATITGSTAGDGLGEAVSIVGDTNYDGYEDLVVNIYKHDYGSQTESGAAILILGGTSSISGSLTSGNASVSFNGARINDYAGWVVGPAGDQDGDKKDDWFLTAYQHDGAGAVADVGRLAVINGALAPSSTSYVVGATSTYQALITGTVASGRLGSAATGGDDYNNDGYPDIVVSAPTLTSGEVYGFFGPLSGTYTPADADVILNGAATSDELGNSLAGLGDVTGDGTDDLAVGAHKRDNGATADVGTAFLFSGSSLAGGTYSITAATASISGVVASDFVGRTVSTAGDVDFDGYNDVLVGGTGIDSGATLGTGAVALLYGPITGSTTLSSGVLWYGSAANEAVGVSLAGGGDVNGDKYSDYLMGGNTKSGANVNGGAYLFYGIGE